MIGVDTNLMIRYLTRDDEQQWQQAIAVIQENQPCFITNIVLCEVAWVLKGASYGFRRDEIISALEAILHSSAFVFENRSAVDLALQQAKQGRADFSDYLIGAIASQAGCTETVSFDRKLKGEKGFRCLEDSSST